MSGIENSEDVPWLHQASAGFRLSGHPLIIETWQMRFNRADGRFTARSDHRVLTVTYMLETVICFSFLCASPFPAACDAGQGCPAGGPHSGTAVAIAHVKALAGKCSKMATNGRGRGMPSDNFNPRRQFAYLCHLFSVFRNGYTEAVRCSSHSLAWAKHATHKLKKETVENAPRKISASDSVLISQSN